MRDALAAPERLRVLDATGLMDSRPEDHLDRWSQVTAEALDAPVAAISLLDDRRQFFKSSFGLEGRLAADRGTPATHSLCQYVVAGEAPLAVEDARRDAALAEREAVTEHGVVAYAGAPLVVSGQPIGALCVIAPEPRAWSAQQLRLLDNLALGVAYEFQLRVSSDELAHGSALTQAQNHIHELIAGDRPLELILDAIVTSIETHDPTLWGSILLLDPHHRTLHHGAAPRLPDTFSSAVDGLGVGPFSGSCGASAWSGEEVITHDIESDPRWEGYRTLVEPLGLRHCWSFPAVRSDGTVLGTFGVYGHRPRSPSENDKRFLRDAAKLAGIAIERRRTHDRLVFEATHDALTGLRSRAAAISRLDEILGREPEERGPVSVLFVDLDRLRVINDSLGHATGDHVIRQAARRLSGCTAPTDLVARLGGEEFVLVTSGGEAHAIALARRALATLRAPLVGLPHGRDHVVTGSIGIAVITDEGVDAQEAIRRADTAKRAAMSRGGDQYALGDTADVAALNRRLRIETGLRRAVAREELGLVFQPLQRFADAETVAVEALLRWRHHELGDVAPGEFIPIAEQTGLIGELGAWVLTTACAALPGLAAEYDRPLQLWINVSAQQLHDPAFPGVVSAALAAESLPADRLHVEITETALLASDEATEQTVDALHDLGISIALDDFGVGYSSLAVLKRYPIGAIKLDRSFIAGLPAGRDDLAIVKALIVLARGLGLGVVTEGIETEEQYELLRELGCDLAQGYFVGRPAAAHR